MKHITTIEGLSLDEFDAWLHRDWSLYIFPPGEWHGHWFDKPAPVKMKTYPKTLVEAGYTFTQQIGADQVKQVGWVYVAKIAKGIKIESDMQPPHDRNFAEWIDWRLGRSAQPADEAQTAETTPAWYQQLTAEDRRRHDLLSPYKQKWIDGEVIDADIAKEYSVSVDTIRRWRHDLGKRGAPDMDWYEQRKRKRKGCA